MSSTAETSALAGLIHDIGKFWQRATSENVHPDFRQFGSENYGANGAHATYSAAFVQQVLPERWQQAVMSGVLWHHLPGDEQARLVALADRLSVGVDRASGETVSDSSKELVSIFSRLRSSSERNYVPLQELELSEAALMPHTEAHSELQNTYADLWAAFRREAEGLSTVPSLAAYLEGMLALFQRFTWCIPSADYGSEPDISLYDHSRTVAALSACLSGLSDDRIQSLLNGSDEQPVVTFVEGDLSGIQRFLYTIPARGAAKQLRARSLYLQLLTDAAARWQLRRAGMPPVNLIYSGGGRFFALLPYMDDGDDSLMEAQRDLDRLLLKHHDGALYLSLGWTHLSMPDFANPDRFSAQWRAVTAATNTAKRAHYRALPEDELFTAVFEPRSRGEADEFSLRGVERDEIDADEEDARGALSALGQSFEQFSRRLAHADYLLVSMVTDTPSHPAGFDAVLRELGLEVQPVSVEELGRSWRSGEPPADVDYALLQGLRTAPGERELAFLRRQWNCPVVGTLRFTVNVTPMLNDGDQPVTFDRLQEAAAAEGAIKRLGVLRMDVDDLGTIFAEGFRDPKTGASRASLARVASLSFAFGLFFEGWVGELCARANRETVAEIRLDERGHFDRVEAVYAVYSGGDDLFIVGRWDVLPQLAYDIRSDLARYVAQTPTIHLSAGITLHGGKYPLYQMAEEAKDALDRAKAMDGKDAVCFLGQPLKWANWDELTAVRDELYAMVAVQKAPRAVLQLLLQLYDDYDHALREASLNKAGETQVVWGAWQWRSAYQFAQLAERRKETRAGVEGLYARLRQSNFKGIITMGLAARWVEALTRKGEAQDHRGGV